MELLGKEFIGPLGLVNSEIPDIFVVYIIALSDTEKFEPIYIGIANNLKQRIKQHQLSGTIAEMIKDPSLVSIFYCEFSEDNRNEAQEFEKHLISNFKPPFNLRTFNPESKLNTERMKSEKTRKYSSIVALATSTMAIATIITMLFGIWFDKTKTLTRGELTNKILKLESIFISQKEKIEDISSEVVLIKNDLKSISNFSKSRKWVMEASKINHKLVIVENKMSALETALTNDPTKALAVPILRKDLDNTRDSLKSDLAQTKSEIDRIYDLNKWFFGLMFTIALSVSGMAISNFLSRKDS